MRSASLSADGGEPGQFVLGESGQADMMADGLEFLQHSNEAVLVNSARSIAPTWAAAVRVGVLRVRLQVRDLDKLIVSAVDGHAGLAFMPNPERQHCARIVRVPCVVGGCRLRKEESLIRADDASDGSRASF